MPTFGKFPVMVPDPSAVPFVEKVVLDKSLSVKLAVTGYTQDQERVGTTGVLSCPKFGVLALSLFFASTVIVKSVPAGMNPEPELVVPEFPETDRERVAGFDTKVVLVSQEPEASAAALAVTVTFAKSWICPTSSKLTSKVDEPDV